MRNTTPIIAAFVAIALAGCSPTYRNHGYIPPEEELQELAVGVDTRSSVEDLVGSPSSRVKGGDFFYVSSTFKTAGARAPKVVERQVLAMTFDENGVLQNIERYGLEDGQVVVLSRRVTSSGATDVSFIRQLFGNIGAINPASALGGV